MVSIVGPILTFWVRIPYNHFGKLLIDRGLCVQKDMSISCPVHYSRSAANYLVCDLVIVTNVALLRTPPTRHMSCSPSHIIYYKKNFIATKNTKFSTINKKS